MSGLSLRVLIRSAGSGFRPEAPNESVAALSYDTIENRLE